MFLLSPGDSEQADACEATGARCVTVPWKPGPGDYARKINVGARVARGSWLFLGADDLRFHAGYDEYAYECGRDGRTKVIGTNDLGNPSVRAGKHSTHSFVERDYAMAHGLTWDRKPGLVYADAYDHQYVDTELVSVAIDRGIFRFCAKSVVEHLHPLWQKGTMDDTYRKALERGNQDRALFKMRREQLGATE